LTVPGGQETLENMNNGIANADVTDFSDQKNYTLGRVSIGWSIGEDVLFNNKKQANRKENCFAETESCLLGISK